MYNTTIFHSNWNQWFHNILFCICTSNKKSLSSVNLFLSLKHFTALIKIITQFKIKDKTIFVAINFEDILLNKMNQPGDPNIKISHLKNIVQT